MEGLIAKEIKGTMGLDMTLLYIFLSMEKLRQNLIQKRRTGLVIEEKHWL